MNRPVAQLAAMPTAQGGLSRLAAGRVRSTGTRLEPLLAGAGLTSDQIADPNHRISVKNQIAFLGAAAEAVDDDFLGLSLAKDFDLRDLGLLYYVMASSETFGTALRRASRYSRITNEAIVLDYHEAIEPTLRVTYSGVPRHLDVHQIEFCVAAIVRVARTLTRRQFAPKKVSMSHVRFEGRSKFARLLGTDVRFGSAADEITFPSWISGVGAGRRRSEIERHFAQSLRGWPRSPQTRCRRVSYQGGEYDCTIAPPRPGPGERRGKKARYYRANAGAQVRTGWGDLQQGVAGPQGKLGYPLS